jgi:polyisoprenoid-binding protein YceI
MVIATVKGRFNKFDVDVKLDEAEQERSSVEARIDASSLETKNEMRDTHLRSPDFLDVEKHPYITFVSKRIERRGDGRYTLVGDLTIRGVTREVTLDTEFSGFIKDPWGNQRAGFAAEATLNRKDFGLTWNMALESGGLLVGDTVKVSIEAELVKQAQ